MKFIKETIKLIIHIFLAICSTPFVAIGFLKEFVIMGIEEGEELHNFLYTWISKE